MSYRRKTNPMITQEHKPRCREAKFPDKLWEVVNDNSPLVWWGDDGRSIIIDGDNFEEEVMWRHPGLVQIPTFANLRRQLRWYDFDWSFLNSGHFQFNHPFFIRGHPDLLPGVIAKRRSGIKPAVPIALMELLESKSLDKTDTGDTHSDRQLPAVRRKKRMQIPWRKRQQRGWYRAYRGKGRGSGSLRTVIRDFSMSHEDDIGPCSFSRNALRSEQPPVESTTRVTPKTSTPIRKLLSVPLACCPESCPCLCHMEQGSSQSNGSINPSLEWFYSCFPYGPSIEYDPGPMLCDTSPFGDLSSRKVNIPMHFHEASSSAESGCSSLLDIVTQCEDGGLGLDGNPVAKVMRAEDL